MEFVFRLLNHLIAIDPKVLYWVCSAVVDGEGWLVEASRQLSSFDSMREG